MHTVDKCQLCFLSCVPHMLLAFFSGKHYLYSPTLTKIFLLGKPRNLNRFGAGSKTRTRSSTADESSLAPEPPPKSHLGMGPKTKHTRQECLDSSLNWKSVFQINFVLPEHE